MFKTSLYLILAYFLFANLSADLTFETKKKSIKPDLKDSIVKTGFNFTNKGNHPVELLKVRCSCGSCATAKIGKKKRFLKEESGQINVTVYLRNHLGTFQETVWLQVKKKNSKSIIKLIVEIHLPEIFTFNPEKLHWNQYGQTTKKIVVIKPVDKIDFEIISVKSGNAAFKTSFSKSKKGDFWELVIYPIETNRKITDSIQIRTNIKTKTGTFKSKVIEVCIK